MDKFQTNAAGNIDSGTEVLANNLIFMQDGTEKLFTDFFGNTFTTGIINTDDANTMFPLTANADGTFNVGIGTAYVFDPTAELYKRIEINLDNMAEYNVANPTQTTNDGTGTNVVTPKSTGCLNIPIASANVTYWIDLQYLQVCDNGNTGDGLGLKNYSIAKKIDPTENNKKRFYQWTDGYKIVLQSGGKQNVEGICLGTVMKDSSNNVTVSYTDKADNLLINPKMFLEYLTSGRGMVIETNQVTNKTTISVNVDDITSLPFSINDGPSISFLTVAGNVIDLNVPISGKSLILHPAYLERYSVNNATNIDGINIQVAIQEIEGVGETVNGIYTLCINNTDKANGNTVLAKPKFEIMEYIYVSDTQPTSKGYRIWFNTSSQPYRTYWYNGNDWVDYYGVPVAYIKITNTTLGGVSIFDYNKDYTQWDKLGSLMPYSVKIWNIGLLPKGYLTTVGSWVNKLDYYDLFMKYSKYNSEVSPLGQTANQIQLPDTRNRVLWGYDSIVQYIDAGLPNIKGDFAYVGAATTQANNAFSALTVDSSWTDSHDRSGTDRGISFNANNGSVTQNIYKDDCDTVQPPALGLPILIKAML